MISITEFTLTELFTKAVGSYGPQRMCGMVDSEGFTYAQWGSWVLSLRERLIARGLKPGDRAAILGENSPYWTMAYFAVVTAGAVAVPILNDFHQREIENILIHSEAKMALVAKKYLPKIGAYGQDESNQVLELDGITPPDREIDLVRELSALPKASKDDLASLIYTSGTTGMSKGVMLTHGNIMYDGEVSARSFIKLNPGEKMLSILPLSHSYEFTIGLILGMIGGQDTYYLGRPPMASVLLPALEKVKPHIMLSVPLLIEKVYRGSVRQKIQKSGLLRLLTRIPFMRKVIHRKAGKQLKERFGGRLKFFGVGGAPLDREVERFLQEAKFPYGIGYGLTETAPLLAGCAPSWTRLASTGKVLDIVEMRIADPHPETGEGEIQVRGPNVMQGYYQDEEATKEAFTEDGWFRTGDLGIFDKDDFLYIKGRQKNMILGPNGENIYPESIESVINSFDFVEESIVLPSSDGLVAQVKLDLEAFSEHIKDAADQAGTHAREYAESLLHSINKELNVNSRVRKVKLLMEPLVRTPTKKIKRFLYRGDEDETKQDENHEDKRKK